MAMNIDKPERRRRGGRRKDDQIKSVESVDVVLGSPPSRIGKYTIREELGHGAAGVVYRGFDPFIQRDVAIKVALPSTEVPAAEKNEYERAFFAEARAIGRLTHPHIVALYDASAEGHLNYLVMEFIDGTTLAPLCRPNALAPIEQVINIIAICAKALDYAHDRGVLHRDIKPGNIMLTKDNAPKVMDFSIADIIAHKTTSEQPLIGSPRYMSPEQISGAPLGPASDLYSLGTVLYLLLTGQAPFQDAANHQELFAKIMSTPAPRVDSVRQDLPKALADIVTRLLLKDPNERYQSGNELATALLHLNTQIQASGQRFARRENDDALRRLSFFSTFTEEEINEILQASKLMYYSPGTAIIKEGDFDHSFYIIVDGIADVRKNSRAISTLGKGSCIGEIGFLGWTKRTASVIAQTTLCALKVNASLMDQVSQECQLRFYKVFTETLIYRLTTTSAKLSAATEQGASGAGAPRPPDLTLT